MVTTSHSAHNDNRPDPASPSPSPLSTDRPSTALLALGNNREAQEQYLRSKTFSYNELPEWLRVECFSITRPFYENNVTDILITSLYQNAVKLANERTTRGGKFLMALRPKKASTPPLPKKALTREVENSGPFGLTPEVFEQLGLSQASNLYELLETSKVSVSGYKTPEATERKIEGALVRAGFTILKVPPVMPPFTPVAGSPFVKHATEAYDTIVGRIIAFHIVADIIASHHLPLEQEHIQKIVHEVSENPFEDLAASSRLRLIMTYAEHYERYPTCTSLISREEAIRFFAFNRRPITDLNAEEAFRHQQQRAYEEAQRAQSVPTTPKPLHPPPQPIVDEHREIILKAARPNTHESAIVHLQRAARFHRATPLELEKLLRVHLGDVEATLAALKTDAQPVDPVEDESPSEPSSKADPILKPFTFIAHTADHGFTKWFNGLSDDEQTRVRDALKNVARRCTGITKPIKGDHYKGLYEVRVMDCQLRIYYRYIPGMRIVLLTGGGKGDSRTGHQHDIERAARYRDEYNHCTVDTDLSDSVFDPEM